MKIIKPILITLFFLLSSIAFAQEEGDEGDTSSEAESSSQSEEGDSSSQSSQSSVSIPPIIWPPRSSSSSNSSSSQIRIPPMDISQEKSGCDGKEDCFPKGSDYFGVTTGRVAEVVKKAKQGPSAGAQSAIEEMYGNAIRGSGWDDSGWAGEIKASSQVGTPEHIWKDGRGTSDSRKDYVVDSRLAVAVKAEKIKKGLPEDVKEVDNLNSVSYDNFHECFEPRWLSNRCNYCNPQFVMPFSDCIPRDNRGYVWEYWWPEFTVDVNGFGIASINPVDAFQRKDLLFKQLLTDRKSELKDKLKEHMSELSERDKLDRDSDKVVQETLEEIEKRNMMDDPIGGQSHFSGTSPDDQTQSMESHLYKTKVTTDNHTYPFFRVMHGGMGEWWIPTPIGCIPICPYWYNGYIWKNNFKCHYDSIPDKLPEKLWAAGWTEQAKYAPYWRFPELSGNIDSAKYRASVPYGISFSPQNNEMETEQLSYLRKDTCSSFRSITWPNIYGDLPKVFKLTPKLDLNLKEICYIGGGQLYPLTGTLMGAHHPLTSAALIARRAIELVYARPEYAFLPNVPRFTDDSFPYGGSNSIDKLQMVYPRYSKCFRMNKTVGEAQDLPYVEDIGSEFPPDEVDPKQVGAVRFIFWNRRTTCSCQYRSTYEDTMKAGPDFKCNAIYGWGCQVFENRPSQLGRGKGSEILKDKFYGSEQKKDEHFADAAWQLYFRMYFGKGYPWQHFMFVDPSYEKFGQ